jgi:hypothetical protein
VRIGKTTLAKLGLGIALFAWAYFAGTWLMEKLNPPLWVLADPSTSIARTNLRYALIVSAIGAVMIIIDRLAGSRDQEE